MLEAPCNHRLCSLWGQPKLGLRTARFAQHRGLLARTLMPVDDSEAPVWHQRFADSLGRANTIWHAMERVRHEDEVSRPGRKTGKLIGIARAKLAIADAAFFSRVRATSNSTRSMSMATTCRAILAICKVNQPSPEHRSMTPIPRLTPTAISTPAGSGHSTSHQPAVGISVPSKKPGRLLVIAGILSGRLPQNANLLIPPSIGTTLP